jgi:amino acid adenylation domain-containing protein
MQNDEMTGRDEMDGLGAQESVSVANERLSDPKRELLERRLRGARASSAPADISARPEGLNPMSFGQERLWFQQQITDNPALFNIAFLARIDGDIDISALTGSVNDVIARHEILRAGFVSDEGAPQQFFVRGAPLDIDRVELSDHAEAAAERAMRLRAQTDARAPFDLSVPPLMRITLFKLAPLRHALLFVVHHIIWDGWSSGVFIEEMTRLYQARKIGAKASLPPIATQYADFAFWHRRLVASAAGERQIDYWKRQLAGLPERIFLPTDYARQAQQAHAGAKYEWRLSDQTAERIGALARRENVTLFAILLAAYNVLLMHYSGQGDIAIGTTIAYRTQPALEKLVGFFANALVMRTPIDDESSFAAFVARTQQTSVDAQSNQDAPFDMLVERLAPKRDLSYNPLFQVAFVLHNLPIEELRIGDMRINFEEIDTGSATFDLVFHIFSEAGGLKASFEYDAHLFDARTMRAMAAHFDSLLDQLVSAPDRPISSARPIDTRQEAEMLAQSRRARVADASGLLASLAHAGAPDATAVRCGDVELSYEELFVRADRLAWRLRMNGVVPDAPVAMLIEPSVDMIVAILGILKSDGAYLPLDPSYPAKRIESILKDSGARVVVTSAQHADTVAWPGVDVIRLGKTEENEILYPSDAPTPRARPENIAYYIYTSGSSGLSKGVMISHAAAVASTRAREQFYSGKVTCFLLLSSVSFDSSIAGIFWTLAQGGTLCIATEAERRDPGALARMISTARVSHLLCLPSLYSALLDVADPAHVAALRCCIVAGESCRAELAERHFGIFPQVDIVNEYGPTECAVWSTAHRIEKVRSGAPVAIGQPIPGAQTLVLRDGELVPHGAVGEIWIGGAGLARGYLGRPDLTAERFRPNPFGGSGDRLYRTGDSARLNADDDLEFLGRLDDQLKLRGYRIDPRELESVMLDHPDVIECVVVARTRANGQQTLLAYCLGDGGTFDVGALKLHASTHLPQFMVPDAFVPLDAMPMLPNGKIDRNALPEPNDAPSATAEDDSGEMSLVETLIADIWREALGIENVKRSDNFFDLGGNSLIAIQVAARAQQTFGRDVSVVALFDSADLGAFAKALEAALPADFDREFASLLSQLDSESVA